MELINTLKNGIYLSVITYLGRYLHFKINRNVDVPPRLIVSVPISISSFIRIADTASTPPLKGRRSQMTNNLVERDTTLVDKMASCQVDENPCACLATLPTIIRHINNTSVRSSDSLGLPLVPEVYCGPPSGACYPPRACQATFVIQVQDIHPGAEEILVSQLVMCVVFASLTMNLILERGEDIPRSKWAPAAFQIPMMYSISRSSLTPITNLFRDDMS